MFRKRKVLPTPFGPSRMMLTPSSRKPRSSSWIALHVKCLGEAPYVTTLHVKRRGRAREHVRAGQVFAYDPAADALTLVLESTDRALPDAPDNMHRASGRPIVSV